MNSAAAYIAVTMISFTAVLAAIALYDWIARKREAKKH